MHLYVTCISQVLAGHVMRSLRCNAAANLARKIEIMAQQYAAVCCAILFYFVYVYTSHALRQQ